MLSQSRCGDVQVALRSSDLHHDTLVHSRGSGPDTRAARQLVAYA